MKILETSVFRGPNIYALFPVIRHVVDLGVLEDWPSAKLGDGFVGGLLEALPGLHEHGCSYGEPGGFVRRLREDGGTWLGHVWEHMAIELQNVASAEVTFGKTPGAPTSISTRSATPSSSSPSAARWGRAPPRWSRLPAPATSPGCG